MTAGKGVFASSSCTEEGGAKEFILVTPTKTKLTLKTGTLTRETPGVGSETCTSSSGKGTITGATSTTVVLVLSGCSALGKKCTSPGEEALGNIGKIETFELLGTLEEREPGVVTTRLAGNGPEFEGKKQVAEFNCGELHKRIVGTITGEDNTLFNEARTETKLIFNHSGGLEEEIEGLVPFVPSNWTATTTETTGTNHVGIFGVI